MSAIKSNIELDNSWKKYLLDEFQQPYFSDLKLFLQEEKKQHSVFPPGNLIFNAFNITPFENVKVVILGQDPYHGEGQAEGLSFSVPKDVKMPPSLKNIYKELYDDLQVISPQHGNLQHWATQGVLLLNTALTVRANNPASHRNKGWEKFTDKVIQTLNNEKEHLVFILWGNHAREKANQIDGTKHLILEAAHPSPFSAHNGFFGCKHFSKTNAFLHQHGLTEIHW